MKRLLTAHCLLFTVLLLLAGLACIPENARATTALQPANFTAMPEAPKTIRQQIVDKTLLRLGRIQTANGFQTDIGLALQASEQRQDADSPPSMNQDQLGQYGRFGVFDSNNEQDQTAWDEGKIPNTLQMQALWFHRAEMDAAALREAIGDMKKALIEDDSSGARDATFGGLLIGIKPVSDNFARPQGTYQVDACGVQFSATFYTEPFNDYE